MQNTLDWNKLSIDSKAKIANIKDLAFIQGAVQMSDKRIRDIISLCSESKILFGCLKDEEIPGLEGSSQFTKLELDQLENASKYSSETSVLTHFHKDTVNIINELQPSKVIFVNGSWSGPLHYTRDYWAAINLSAEVNLVSPFTSEREAKSYCTRVQKTINKFKNKLYFKTKKYNDTELLELAYNISRFSWDWIGQIGAVLSKNGRVKASAWNRVLPYEAYQMHFGSIREQRQIPSQEMIETQLTNHAECEILEISRRNKVNLKGTTLYLNMFPCPVCAKILARTEIEKIIYSEDHNLGNNIGYKILEASGKKIKRIIL